jgi:NitT/TauT family transport system substrate-binding protein
MSLLSRFLAFPAILIAMAAAALPARAERLVISQYGVSSASLPWAIALKLGYFKDEGLAIESIIGSAGGGTTIRNMMATELPFAEVSLPATIAAIQSGLDLKLIMSSSDSHDELAWVVKRDSPIQSLAHLKGKTITFTAPKSVTEMIARTIMKREGLYDQVKFLSSNGVGNGLTMLAHGSVDATVLSEPTLTKSANKYRIIVRVSDHLPEIAWSVGITTPDFAAKQPDKLRALIKARRRAVDFIYEKPAEAARIYADLFGVEPAIAAEVLGRLSKTAFWSRGRFSRKGLDTMIEGMRLVGALDKPFEIEEHIDRRFLPADQRD